MKFSYIITVCVGILLLVGGCVESFLPPESTSGQQYLVVDALLDTDRDTLSVTLSRTRGVNPKDATFLSNGPQELGAQLSIEGNQGSLFVLTEVGKGNYQIARPALRELEQYSLRIKTADGKEYVSDYQPWKKSPPMDSLTYQISPRRDGVQVFVNTHDPLNQSWFYRWKFEETYEYHTYQYATLETGRQAGRDTLVPRDSLEEAKVKICWRSERPTKLVLGTSVQLSQDIIRNLPIFSVPSSGNKLLYAYSLLVKQYALTPQAYEFWTNVAKTNELTGSIFDPLPGQVTGNLRCLTVPGEPVFGFFGIYAPATQRILVRVALGGPNPCPIFDDCSRYLSYSDALSTRESIVGTCLIPSPDTSIPPIVRYVTVSPACTDCRQQGGTIVKPPFMP